MPDAGRPSEQEGEFYISASGSPLEQRTRVLKSGDSFAIFDGLLRPRQTQAPAAGKTSSLSRGTFRRLCQTQGENPTF